MSSFDNNVSDNNVSDNEFDSLNKKYNNIRQKIIEIEKEKRLLENEYRNIQKELQSKCKHVFVREETTSGCYREVHDICTICDLWN